MKYRDLVQFEQIDSVIQLRKAPDEAEKLIATYVISDDMADRIADRLMAQLSFDDAVDHKGVLIVGNYGTGKSHLMSVLSLVAEHADYAPKLRHAKVAQAAAAIAGRFKVLRIEIGGLEMPLRQIITQHLERFLDELGVAYRFPSGKEELDNKESFEEMMAAFNDVYPNHGLLLVVDEFLEYLQSRKDLELARDLAILRQIGEVSRHLRFRFVAGVQEVIFDNARFAHVADSMRRVNERFTQILIGRQDVSFVVCERLLKKTADQQSKIRAYLTPFAKFYDAMNERMDEYVRLFPVHPDYLKIFEQLHFTEKRGALKTIEDAMKNILDQEVPADRPQLICYESFWDTVKANPVLRADPDIREVLRVFEVLEARIMQAIRPAYKPMALRIIKALAVQRLTTGGDIHLPIGPTALELRDTLCLFQPVLEELSNEPAENLLTMVETALREIVKTVNGQFISKAPDTEQYYLDLKKNIDYDTQIEKRAESLSDDALDRGYYNAVKTLMECSDEPSYITNRPIWQYQIEWQEHRVERIGYLFLGAPNERPTAQPERDFYIYFLQPFDKPKFSDKHLADEVFFRLKSPDEDFRQPLAHYAAALELASTASGGAKSIYLDKAQESLAAMSQWLQEKQMSAFEVSYQGKTQMLQNAFKGVSLRDRARLNPDERINFRDAVNVVSGLKLSQHFADIAPEYPVFSVLLSENNRKQMVINTLRTLAGEKRSKDATAVLDALELLDGERIDPAHSRYAQAVLKQLKNKGHGQVLNRSELLVNESDIAYFAPQSYRLEPDLLVVVLGALVYAGDIVLSITGNKIDSGRLNLLSEQPLEDLKNFKHIEAPKELNMALLRGLFELFNLPFGLAQKVSQGSDEPIALLQEKISALVQRLLKAGTDIQQGKLSFWGQGLVREEESQNWHARLDSLKKFSEDLSPYNTVGKLKNLRISEQDVETQKSNLSLLAHLEKLLNAVADLGPTAAYLSQAELTLPEHHAWREQAKTLRNRLFAAINAQSDIGRTAEILREERRALNALKNDYINAYIALHSQARLGIAEEKNHSALLRDPRLNALRLLSSISLMPISQLTEFENKLSNLKSCSALTETALRSAPTCPHCHLRPSAEQQELIPAANILSQLDRELSKLLADWQQTLLNNLEDPFAKESREVLPESDQKIINDFLRTQTLPEPLSDAFIQAAQQALSGLEKVGISTDALKRALLATPAGADELRHRLEKFISEHSKGKDLGKLRFVVEEEEAKA